MKYFFASLILVFILLPQVTGAQWQQEFTVEAEIFSETTGTESEGGSTGGTRVDRHDPVTAPSAVPNVRNVAVRERGAGIEITWDNPAVDFAAIRVIKDDFYAADPYDGWVIYNSRGEVFSDANPGSSGVFYTFFVMMPDGRASSGVTIFYKDDFYRSEEIPPPVSLPPTPTEDTEVATTTEATGEPSEEWWARLPLIGQQASRATQFVGMIFVGQFSAAEDVTFSLPARILPPGIESMVLIVENKQTGTFERFNMRRDGSVLIATVPRRLYAGEYVVGIVLYDYEQNEQGKHFRTIDVYPHYFTPETAAAGRVLVTDYIIMAYALTVVILLLCIWRLWVVIKRR